VPVAATGRYAAPSTRLIGSHALSVVLRGSPFLRAKSFLCCRRARRCQVPTGCPSSADTVKFLLSPSPTPASSRSACRGFFARASPCPRSTPPRLSVSRHPAVLVISPPVPAALVRTKPLAPRAPSAGPASPQAVHPPGEQPLPSGRHATAAVVPLRPPSHPKQHNLRPHETR
jgi:hypothetical protein